MRVPLTFLRTEVADCLVRMALALIILVQLIGVFVGRSMGCEVDVDVDGKDDTVGGDSNSRGFQWCCDVFRW